MSGKGRFICREITKIAADGHGHQSETEDSDDSAHIQHTENDVTPDEDDEDITSDDFESGVTQYGNPEPEMGRTSRTEEPWFSETTPEKIREVRGKPPTIIMEGEIS